MTHRRRLGLVALILGLAIHPSSLAGSAPADDGPLPCADVIVHMERRLPDAAKATYPVRPAGAWPSFDPTTATMFPDTVLGEPVRHGYRRGSDSVRPYDDGLPVGPTLASRLGRPDEAQHGVTNRDLAAVRSVFADPERRLNISATRIDGVSGVELLPAVVRHRLAGRTEAVCEVRTMSDVPVLYAVAGGDRFAFMSHRDAWLMVDTLDETLQAVLYEPPEPWLPERFDRAVTEVALTIAALPPDLAMPSLRAPDRPTRITPPAQARALTRGLPNLNQEDTPVEFVGAGEGMLGIGMVPGALLTDRAPSLGVVADQLGLDPSLLWGDIATGSLEVVAHIDPEGDGERWVRPLADAFQRTSTLLADPGAAGERIGGSSTLRVSGGRWLDRTGLVVTSDSDAPVAAFYADGPYVFQIHIGAGSGLTVEDVVWFLGGETPDDTPSG